MKVGLLSDTHGRTDLVESVTDVFRNLELSAIVHTGDVTRVSHVQPILDLGLTVHLVYGNCDFNHNSFRQAAESTPLTLHGRSGLLNTDGLQVGITHGHHKAVLDQLADSRPDYIVHGHTHVRRDEQKNGIRYINPGSVQPPNSSWATLDLSTGRLDFFGPG